MKKEDVVFVKHIIDNIENIKLFIKNITKSDFLGDEEKQYAVVRALEIIGEAVKNISQEIKDEYPKIEWKAIAGTRDRIIHAYFNVDLNIVWEIIKEDLPKLKKEISRILDKSEK